MRNRQYAFEHVAEDALTFCSSVSRGSARSARSRERVGRHAAFEHRVPQRHPGAAARQRIADVAAGSPSATRGSLVEHEIAVADAAAVRQDEARRRQPGGLGHLDCAVRSAPPGCICPSAVRRSRRAAAAVQTSPRPHRIASAEGEPAIVPFVDVELVSNRRAARAARPTRGSTPRDPPACARRASRSGRATSRCRTRTASGTRAGRRGSRRAPISVSSWRITIGAF